MLIFAIVGIIILAIFVFKVLIPLIEEMKEVIISWILASVVVIALCIAFPPLIIFFVIAIFIFLKTKDK